MIHAIIQIFACIRLAHTIMLGACVPERREYGKDVHTIFRHGTLCV